MLSQRLRSRLSGSKAVHAAHTFAGHTFRGHQLRPTSAHSSSQGIHVSYRDSRVGAASLEYETLRNYSVQKISTGEVKELLSLWEPAPGNKVALVFLTHFADLSSWELAQKLVKLLPTLTNSGVQLYAVGLGSIANAQEFARVLQFPTDRLFADPDGSIYKQLGFSPGFGDGVQISAYAKLLPMLAGIGSPGTMQEVLRGYIGDKASQPVFTSPTPFDVLGTGYQRPFELATLRLFNMVGILPKWSALSPPKETLLTQQGGTLAFDGDTLIFRHDDAGILKYTDVDELCRAVLAADYTFSTAQTTITVDV